MKSRPLISYSRSKDRVELSQILEIQRRNVKIGLSAEEIASQGFVTVVHDLELLEKMHLSCAHILAKDSPNVVGYALAMVPGLREDVPILAPLFELTDSLMPNVNYLVMGQICIDKPYRGMGIFSGLYKYYREQLKQQYHCLVTEVAVENQRSLQAHLHAGFEILHTRVKNEVQWEMLVWNWNE